MTATSRAGLIGLLLAIVLVQPIALASSPVQFTCSSGLWSQPSCWSSGSVPGPQDHAVVSAAQVSVGDGTSYANYSVGSISLLEGTTLLLNVNAALYAPTGSGSQKPWLSVDNSTLHLYGGSPSYYTAALLSSGLVILQNHSLLRWRSSTLQNVTLHIDATSEVSVYGQANDTYSWYKYVDPTSTVLNQGLYKVESGAAMMQVDGLFYNAPGATVDLRSASLWCWDCRSPSTAFFHNHGTLKLGPCLAYQPFRNYEDGLVLASDQGGGFDSVYTDWRGTVEFNASSAYSGLQLGGNTFTGLESYHHLHQSAKWVNQGTLGGYFGWHYFDDDFVFPANLMWNPSSGGATGKPGVTVTYAAPLVVGGTLSGPVTLLLTNTTVASTTAGLGCVMLNYFTLSIAAGATWIQTPINQNYMHNHSRVVVQPGGTLLLPDSYNQIWYGDGSTRVENHGTVVLNRTQNSLEMQQELQSSGTVLVTGDYHLYANGGGHIQGELQVLGNVSAFRVGPLPTRTSLAATEERGSALSPAAAAAHSRDLRELRGQSQRRQLQASAPVGNLQRPAAPSPLRASRRVSTPTVAHQLATATHAEASPAAALGAGGRQPFYLSGNASYVFSARPNPPMQNGFPVNSAPAYSVVVMPGAQLVVGTNGNGTDGSNSTSSTNTNSTNSSYGYVVDMAGGTLQVMGTLVLESNTVLFVRFLELSGNLTSADGTGAVNATQYFFTDSSKALLFDAVVISGGASTVSNSLRLGAGGLLENGPLGSMQWVTDDSAARVEDNTDGWLINYGSLVMAYSFQGQTQLFPWPLLNGGKFTSASTFVQTLVVGSLPFITTSGGELSQNMPIQCVGSGYGLVFEYGGRHVVRPTRYSSTNSITNCQVAYSEGAVLVLQGNGGGSSPSATCYNTSLSFSTNSTLQLPGLGYYLQGNSLSHCYVSEDSVLTFNDTYPPYALGASYNILQDFQLENDVADIWQQNLVVVGRYPQLQWNISTLNDTSVVMTWAGLGDWEAPQPQLAQLTNQSTMWMATLKWAPQTCPEGEFLGSVYLSQQFNTSSQLLSPVEAAGDIGASGSSVTRLPPSTVSFQTRYFYASAAPVTFRLMTSCQVQSVIANSTWGESYVLTIPPTDAEAF